MPTPTPSRLQILILRYSYTREWDGRSRRKRRSPPKPGPTSYNTIDTGPMSDNNPSSGRPYFVGIRDLPLRRRTPQTEAGCQNPRALLAIGIDLDTPKLFSPRVLRGWWCVLSQFSLRRRGMSPPDQKMKKAHQFSEKALGTRLNNLRNGNVRHHCEFFYF